MTPRQRVLTALRLEEAGEPPFTWGFGPTAAARQRLRVAYERRGVDFDRLVEVTDDVLALSPRFGGALPAGTPAYLGIWGIRARKIDAGLAHYDDEIAFAPLEGADRGAIDRHPWPSCDDFDYSALADHAQQRDPEALNAIRVVGGNPVEVYTWMTGMEEAMTNLVAAPRLAQAAMDRIVSFFEEHLSRQLEAIGRDVDIVFMADDLGGQHGPLISREMYRELIQPFHRRLNAHAHRLAPDAIVAHHSDGSVSALLDDMIDAGVDMLEAVQVECAEMEPAILKQRFGARLRFQGAISVQQLLPRGTPAQVHAGCRELIATLGAGGGYIPAPSHAVQAGTPAENIDAMLEAVLGHERLDRALVRSRLAR